ncbi:MAG: hypothetical protein M0C28_36110 [Candidatus Moduliflexus flocculans]|nr:hypothetical protein [Candidatus Moduliflexus flocculans]
MRANRSSQATGRCSKRIAGGRRPRQDAIKEDASRAPTWKSVLVALPFDRCSTAVRPTADGHEHQGRRPEHALRGGGRLHRRSRRRPC